MLPVSRLVLSDTSMDALLLLHPIISIEIHIHFPVLTLMKMDTSTGIIVWPRFHCPPRSSHRPTSLGNTQFRLLPLIHPIYQLHPAFQTILMLTDLGLRQNPFVDGTRDSIHLGHQSRPALQFTIAQCSRVRRKSCSSLKRNHHHCCIRRDWQNK